MAVGSQVVQTKDGSHGKDKDDDYGVTPPRGWESMEVNNIENIDESIEFNIDAVKLGKRMTIDVTDTYSKKF